MKKLWVIPILILLIPVAASEKVERVVDGDTLFLANGETVRLIGIDTPEYYHLTDTEKFGLSEDYLYEWGVKAKLYMEDRILHERVSLEYDWERRDKYDRLLAYVFIDDEMINRTMVKEGYARATPEFDFKYEEEFVQLEKEAKKEGRCMWHDTEVTVDNEEKKNMPTAENKKILLLYGILLAMLGLVGIAAYRRLK
ncbi:MAG: thermonuclease family protein [Euryarchaeota archaeon]|nr:thermonuclease family protein [Euryarchaeota archaeon]